jgi:anaphase-promoting complex subunit 3
MAPSNQQLIAQLRSTIWHHLDNDLLSNALFLAGRLHALDPRNPETIHILALCHQRGGQIKTAYDYTQPPARRGLHLGCAYIFAQACLKLNRPLEGIDAIEKVRSTWENRIDWREHMDDFRDLTY